MRVRKNTINNTDKQALIERVTNLYFEERNITPSDDYKKAVNKTIETLGFYNKGETNRTAVIPLETGQGKTSLVTLLMSELYKFEPKQCGTVILLPYRSACNSMSKKINELTGKEISAAYHSKAKINHKDLKKYPILVMTHNRFLNGIDAPETFAYWFDFGELHEWANEPVINARGRLIVDESINKIELLPISNKTLNILDEFFQQQRNKSDYKLWQTVSCKIRELLVLPVMPQERNKTKIVNLGMNIPPRLIEVVRLSNANNNAIWKAFKAIINLSVDKGILKTSSNPDYRTIETVNYINIFSPAFKNIILDGTARINVTYSNPSVFDVIDIPRTKIYDNVTIHVENRTSGSRSAIEKDNMLISRTKEYIENNLEDKNVLLVCHMENIDLFNDLPENVTVAYWGSFNGTNDFNDRDCIVFCGIPYLSEAYYIFLYHIFSGDMNYNKDRSYRPNGKKDPVMRFANEPLYENIRQSCLATELVQCINRGVCRNYDNEIPMFCFLPFGDNKVLEKIKSELNGIKIVNDYELLDNKITTSSDNKLELVDVVVKVLVNPIDYFPGKKAINKRDIFNLELVRDNFKCNSKKTKSQLWKYPQILELQNIGLLSIENKQINFNKVV